MKYFENKFSSAYKVLAGIDPTSAI